jgi:hypothetical protein
VTGPATRECLGAVLRRTKSRVVRLWHRQALLLTTWGRTFGLKRTKPLQFSR